MSFVIISLVVIIPLLILFWKRKENKPKYNQPSFYGLSCTENGILPSYIDQVFEGIKPRDILYFFGFDKKNSFQLTLKAKSDGCFFVVKIKIEDCVFENCGFLEKEEDGSFRYGFVV